MSVSGLTWHCASSKTSATIEVQTSPSRNAYKQVRIIVSLVWRLAIWEQKQMILLCHYYERSLISQRYRWNNMAHAMNKKDIICVINFLHFGRFSRCSLRPSQMASDIHTGIRNFIYRVFEIRQLGLCKWSVTKICLDVGSTRINWSSKMFFIQKTCIIVFPSLATIRALKKSVVLSSMCFEMLAKPKLGALFFSGPIQHCASKQSS